MALSTEKVNDWKSEAAKVSAKVDQQLLECRQLRNSLQQHTTEKVLSSAEAKNERIQTSIKKLRLDCRLIFNKIKFFHSELKRHTYGFEKTWDTRVLDLEKKLSIDAAFMDKEGQNADNVIGKSTMVLLDLIDFKTELEQELSSFVIQNNAKYNDDNIVNKINFLENEDYHISYVKNNTSGQTVPYLKLIGIVRYMSNLLKTVDISREDIELTEIVHLLTNEKEELTYKIRMEEAKNNELKEAMSNITNSTRTVGQDKVLLEELKVEHNESKNTINKLTHENVLISSKNNELQQMVDVLENKLQFQKLHYLSKVDQFEPVVDKLQQELSDARERMAHMQSEITVASEIYRKNLLDTEMFAAKNRQLLQERELLVNKLSNKITDLNKLQYEDKRKGKVIATIIAARIEMKREREELLATIRAFEAEQKSELDQLLSD